MSEDIAVLNIFANNAAEEPLRTGKGSVLFDQFRSTALDDCPFFLHDKKLLVTGCTDKGLGVNTYCNLKVGMICHGRK